MFYIILLLLLIIVQCTILFAGAMRIIDGAQEHEGRLEVYMNGAWGTICNDFFDDTDATVACRYLGYWYVCIKYGYTGCQCVTEII